MQLREDPRERPEPERPRQREAGPGRSARLQRLREALLGARYTLCTQKAELLTEYFAGRPGSALLGALQRVHWARVQQILLDASRDRQPARWTRLAGRALDALYRAADQRLYDEWIVELARGLVHILERMPLTVYRDELIVGNLTSARVGAALHPDYAGQLIAPELGELASRAVNPLEVRPEQIRALEERVFPFWHGRSVISHLFAADLPSDVAARMLDGRFFVLTQFSGISHLTPDYPTVVARGFRGIAQEIETRLAALDGEASAESAASPEHGRQRAFYRATTIVCEGAIAHAGRWSRQLALLAEREPEPARREELRELAAICRRVPEHGARTFHEALQSVFLTHAMVHQESFQHGVSFGRMDQYLLPYYRRDLAEGRLTHERAVELIGCFLGKAAEALPLFFERATEFFSGLSSASGITIGGTTATGDDASNELSFAILEAYDQMRLRQPNIHARFHARSDPRFRAACYETLKGGGGIPALFNDQAIVPALAAHGVLPRDAEQYSIVGCAEWGVPHKSFPAAGAGFLNLPSALLLALRDGLLDGKREAPSLGLALDSMEAVLRGFRERTRDLVAEMVAINNEIERIHAVHRPTPLLSLLVEGCLERGRDANAGGADYNSTGFQAVGLADCADSLAALERLVFIERRFTLEELMRIVEANFAGHESLRREILNRVAKYGENDGRSDAWAREIARMVDEVVSAFRNPRGGRYLAGFWAMTTHQGFGRRIGALPSGRLAAQPLANGISPTNGLDRRGPTASLLSAASIDARYVGNGCVLNQKLDPRFVAGEAGNAVLDGLVRGYFGSGGMQVQFNILDASVLIDAKKNPERHRDLVVRISGYSAYFNDLTEAMKDELIARTQHGTCSC